MMGSGETGGGSGSRVPGGSGYGGTGAAKGGSIADGGGGAAHPQTDGGVGGATDTAGGLDASPSGPEVGSTTTLVGSGISYTIVGKASGRCVDITDLGSADGTPIQQWDCGSTDNQTFRVEDVGSGAVRLTNPQTGKCIGTAADSTVDGGKVQLWTCNGAGAQAWVIDDLGAGTVRVRNANSAKCLDVTDRSLANGARLQIWTCTGQPNQSFEFHRINGDADSGGSPGKDQDGGTSPGSTDGGSGGRADSARGDGGAGSGDSGGGTTNPPSAPKRVVAYLPNYASQSWSEWARSIDFAQMTHLNLAFATATRSNDWDLGASDGDVAALVSAAHSKNVKVLASLGGGGGDQSVIARYNAGAEAMDDLVNKLDRFVTMHNLDGVDIDIEDEGQLGQNYATFVSKTIAKMQPEGRLVTAAVAQYLQGGMSDTTLHSFDFLNIMIYTTYEESVSQMAWYSGTKKVPKELLTLGAAFFGTDTSGNEYGFRDILDADPSAWDKDRTTVNGQTVRYTGVASMKKLAEFSKSYGGIMFWELSQDAAGAHSLYKAIQDTM